jgi:hypothetical protein
MGFNQKSGWNFSPSVLPFVAALAKEESRRFFSLMIPILGMQKPNMGWGKGTQKKKILKHTQAPIELALVFGSIAKGVDRGAYERRNGHHGKSG